MDFQSKQILFNIVIKDQMVKLRLESNYFTLIDGHLYFGNSCYKIRYDLIQKQNSIQYDSNDIIDQYDDLFDLKNGETIKLESPYDSNDYHKFAYVITCRNFEKLTPKRILIMPYLHDRKIYLNRLKPNTEFFYSSIETSD